MDEPPYWPILDCEVDDWTSGDGVKLFRRQWLPPRAPGSQGTSDSSGHPVVVILHGYGDHSGRYDELASFLARQGMTVVAFDARGHGRSGGQRGYAATLDDYCRDVSELLHWVRERHVGQPVALLGHSNGGLVALRTVQQGLIEVDALVLTSPFLRLQPHRKPMPDKLAQVLSTLLPRLPLPNGLRPEHLTHDKQWIERTRNDRQCLHWATPRWYWQALVAGKLGLQEAFRVTNPTLVISAEKDSIADPAAMAELFEGLASEDKQHWVRTGAFHEPLQETDRVTLFEELAAWLRKRLELSGNVSR